MTYTEAEKKSFETKWIVDTCPQGEDCWCRIIRCDPPLMFIDGDSEEEFYPVDMGQLNKKMAERFVYLHNSNLQFLKTYNQLSKAFWLRKYFRVKELD